MLFFFQLQVPYFLADLDIHMHAINKEYVLNNSQSLLSVIRECNFTLRWLLLHHMVKLYIYINHCCTSCEAANHCYACLFVILHSNMLYHRPVIRRQGTW